MSLRECNTETVDPDWDRYSAESGSDSVVVEQFGDADPQIWIHTSGDCERYTVSELVELAGLD